MEFFLSEQFTPSKNGFESTFPVDYTLFDLNDGLFSTQTTPDNFYAGDYSRDLFSTSTFSSSPEVDQMIQELNYLDSQKKTKVMPIIKKNCDKPFGCDHCGKFFSRRHDLTRHLKNLHKNQS